MLRKTYVKNQGRLIGSVTSGFEGAFESLVRDENEGILGRASERFSTTRDSQGHLVATDVADPGLLLNRK